MTQRADLWQKSELSLVISKHQTIPRLRSTGRASAKSGRAVSGGISAGQQRCEWVFGVSGVMSEGLGDVGGPGQAVQGDGQVPQGGHDLWAVAGADLGEVFT